MGPFNAISRSKVPPPRGAIGEHRCRARPRPLLLRGAEHAATPSGSRPTSPRTRSTTTRGWGRTRAARTIGEHAAWAVENIDGQWYLEHGIEGDRRGRDRVDDDLARPEVGRAAARPRHRVVRLPRRADLRGPRLPPRRSQEPPGGPARLRPRRAAATRCSRTGGRRAAGGTVDERDQGHRRAGRRCRPFGDGARGAARDGAPLRRQGDRPPRRGVGGGAGVPAGAVRALRRARLPRAQVPRGVRRPGRHPPPRRRLGRGAGPLGRLGRGRRRAQRPRLDRDAAGLQLRHRGAAPALDRPRDPRREDRGAGDHRAGRRLRRRRRSAPSPAASTAATSSTAPRPSSPTGSAPTSSSAPARRPRRAATAASPSSCWSARCPATR